MRALSRQSGIEAVIKGLANEDPRASRPAFRYLVEWAARLDLISDLLQVPSISDADRIERIRAAIEGDIHDTDQFEQCETEEGA